MAYMFNIYELVLPYPQCCIWLTDVLPDSELFEIDPELTIGDLKGFYPVKSLKLQCVTATPDETSSTKGVPIATTLNAFNILLAGTKYSFWCEAVTYAKSAPSDKMTDLQSLSVYLKEQDEKGYKAALGCQDMSLNSSSFWSYGRPSLDLSHVFRNNQYKLASQSQRSHKSRTDDSDNLGEEVWRPLGVTDDDLFLWIERLRKSWEVMGVSASSCGIEVVVGASMGNHGANICPQILRYVHMDVKLAV
ncbi:TM209-like protein [Mya arenaria]|uniref:TM209-like protein n=1 Tax=Mya arenaria TaxID=6604 RepID=A0ABY7EYK1_MYAAR|nr:TM209-like protein [Mya arenaria]